MFTRATKDRDTDVVCPRHDEQRRLTHTPVCTTPEHGLSQRSQTRTAMHSASHPQGTRTQANQGEKWLNRRGLRKGAGLGSEGCGARVGRWQCSELAGASVRARL